jgi:hypothetical protein
MKNDSTLAYLRRLNPVPEAASGDGAKLFEQITSLPRDERLAPRRSTTRRRVALVAVGLAVMALLATTALAISGWFGDVVKPPVTRQEYRNAQDELTLPPGGTWPQLNVDPNSVTSRGGGGSSAVMIAMGSWECYWVDAIKSGDQPAAGARRAELTPRESRRHRAGGGVRELVAFELPLVPSRRVCRRWRLPAEAADVRRGGGRQPEEPHPELPGERSVGRGIRA